MQSYRAPWSFSFLELWIFVQECGELKKGKFRTCSCMNGTYSVYVALMILCNLFPIAHVVPHPHFKHMAISERLELGFCILKFRIPHPIPGNNVHLLHQACKILFRSLKILQGFLE
jgi:hypothetical protein